MSWLMALSILCVVLVTTLTVSIYYNIKFGKIIIDMEDACESALGVLDQGYIMMSDLLNIPVMSDSAEVRQLIKQIRAMRDAVFYVSNVLVGPLDGVEEIIEKEEEKESEDER